jgi:DNA polymerase-1
MSRDALLSYRIALNGRLDAISKLVHPEARATEVASIDEVLAFMEAYSDYKEKQKLVTSFTRYGADPDGRVRPSWLMHGTATGRLSCKQPNLAQLPARGDGKEVRQFFIAPEGSKIVDADYENAEVALLGYEAQDDVIIDIYEQKRNIHTENAQFLFGLTPVKDEHAAGYEMWKQARDAAKIFQFGGLSYGGQPRTIHRQMVMKAPKLNLTFAQVDAGMQSWMAAHPAYATWRAAITQEVLTQRKLTNAFGRRRVFLGHPRDIVKEGMNFMIQSAGACLINRAMIRLYDRFEAAHMKTRIIMQIYDEIVLEAPDAEVEDASRFLVEEMTRPFEMHGRKCVLRAEAGVGQTYGDAK